MGGGSTRSSSTGGRHRCLYCLTGGRFKKEVLLDGQSYLLLIRDEGGTPESQVWPPVKLLCYATLCLSHPFSKSK